METQSQIRTEDFEVRNIRFLGYKFLQNITYQNEPVVPQIIREHTFGQKKFDVENVGGEDLLYFLMKKEIPLSERLEAVDVEVGQLKAIDAAGFVLFDRSMNNVRVVSHGKRGVSLRQIDIEEFYDKKTGAFYAERHKDRYEDRVNFYVNSGFSLWCETVSELRGHVMQALAMSGHMTTFDKMLGKYDGLYWGEYNEIHNPLSKSANILDVFRKDLSEIRSKIK